MCADTGTRHTEHGVHVWNGSRSSVHLARRTTIRGYCTVTWRGGHIADPADLNAEDASAYWNDVLRLARAISDVFRPVKINYLILGNLVPHLHTHVVPRYADDPSAGGPLAWETLTEAKETPEAELVDQAIKLRARI